MAYGPGSLVGERWGRGEPRELTAQVLELGGVSVASIPRSWVQGVWHAFGQRTSLSDYTGRVGGIRWGNPSRAGFLYSEPPRAFIIPTKASRISGSDSFISLEGFEKSLKITPSPSVCSHSRLRNISGGWRSHQPSSLNFLYLIRNIFRRDPPKNSIWNDILLLKVLRVKKFVYAPLFFPLQFNYPFPLKYLSVFIKYLKF